MPDNVDLFRQIIERSFDRGDLSVADEICARDFAEHQYLLPSNLPGREILNIEIKSARREIEGLTLSVEDIVASGNKVWARMVARGKDPRSGRDVSIDVLDVCRFSGGRMVEH
jgi:ketosteroid isomerase-like protein